ncbi:MAG TPA: uroporphyrinogen decarboxylase family protein [bacterium]|nr:uroporphyrinogen decarboxylase family protein [bacterium]
MNSYERVLAVISGRIPDRVPIFELLIDRKVIRKITGREDYLDFCERYPIDIVLTNTPSKLYEEKIINSENKIIVNEWGVVRQYTEEEVSIPLEGPIKTPEDLEHYEAPDPYKERRYEELREIVKRFKGKKFIGMHLHDALNYPLYLRGAEQLFIDTIENPALVHRLVDISVRHNIAIAEKAIELGADFIILGDDYGASNGPMMSPRSFREFFLPGIRRIVQSVRSKGAFCFKHCCGNINAIIDDMVSTGISALHPLDISAGMDILAVKNRFTNLTVMGGVNCGAPLTEWSKEALVDEVRSVLERMKSGGRYIISSSNSIHSKVKPENLLSMWETVERYGRYD